MAQYTITINDEPGSVSVGLKSKDDENKTTAFFVAKALMRLVPEVVQLAATAAAKHGNCPCSGCTAKRNGQAAHTEPKPTLH